MGLSSTTTSPANPFRLALPKPAVPRDADTLRRDLTLFQAQGKDRVTAAQDACGRGDVEATLRIVHDLEDLASELGADRMVAICHTIHEAGEEGEIDEVRTMVGFLDRAYARTVRAMRAKLPDPPVH